MIDIFNFNPGVHDPETTSQNQETVPSSSRWHFIFKPLDIWAFDHQPYLWRIGTVKFTLFPFYFCHTILLLACVYIHLKIKMYISPQNYYFLIVSAILSSLSYFRTHFTNPGILPWNWALTRQRVYSSDDLKYGTAATTQQIQWGKTHEWPVRSFFSGSAGFIILRADHFCFWIGQWIGLRNHRYFLQSLFHTSNFLLGFLITLIRVAWKTDYHWKNIYFFLFVGSSIFFGHHHLLNFFFLLRRAIKNRTFIDLSFSKLDNFYDRGIKNNLEEIFGPIYFFPLWFFPVKLPYMVDGFSYMRRELDMSDPVDREKILAADPPNNSLCGA
ncbi:hypothetical protein TRFO_07924 [Tritrichomonas foetus]|uniref:Palmitoyltransferase n=1 Tax=Tritrichomonas foetus TaxID=1144522 RepID=A0A1J4JSU0_9EUKA|nr:hypothetical protein TRFO_07924 [Tritrichomonas foetus]|eukprot:OHT00582.1 hypothetical protein TRFO_07924 [Tritrichomonas foetus]